MSIAYDVREQPPAAFIEIMVMNLGAKVKQPARAKLDTGASVTVIPESLATTLDLKARGEILAQGFDGVGSWRKLDWVSIEVAEFSVPTEVIASSRDHVLLGRDVLNHFVITRDGKAQTFEMVDP